MVCNAKIFKVKHNPNKRNPTIWRQAPPGYQHHEPSVVSAPSSIGSRQYNSGKNMPKSVSGYSLCASNEEEFQRNGPNNGMPTSASSYSMASGKTDLKHTRGNPIRPNETFRNTVYNIKNTIIKKIVHNKCL